MKFFGIISAVFAVSASVATAAPTQGTPNTHLNFASGTPSTQFIELDKREFNRGGALGPLSGVLSALPPPVADAFQAAVAELFKAGDVVLNIPLDAIDNLAHGNVAGALKSIVSSSGGTLKSLPGDAAKILGMEGKKP
ncbi:hypothetical protein QQS21_000021 [Conoideocrella luteorostrata]|uniref:Uncharacterized protein n=1 Tax=Conoideocrella luteorostrata TaxID=1105319 RepID=A0AAJ0CZG1_9HYPO|nr:hypothetical protein QQS21_000021 [Conoideocrella luteorostrata]